MPMLINITNEGNSLHDKWSWYLHLASTSLKLKYLTRKLRATRVVKTSAGILGFKFFDVELSTKGTFYYAVLDHTITALMSIELG